MPKIFKFATILTLLLTCVGILSAAEAPIRDPKKSHLLTSHALIADDFSGLELLPLSNAIRSWMKETSNDITVLPPEQSDIFFYEIMIRGDEASAISETAMTYPDDSKNPWKAGCRNTFYVIRTTSRDPLVKSLDNRDGDPTTGVLAFTYTGCLFKYIVIVADRMNNEDVMYGTMLHELGHMWGLPDNERGQLSVMNGIYPMAPCITKTDLFETYEVFDKSNQVPKKGGCIIPAKHSGK